MKRRDFLTASCLAGLTSLTTIDMATSAPNPKDRAVYEIRKYTLASQDKLNGLIDYYKKAAIPALNRLGLKNIGVFTPEEQKDNIIAYVLITHPNAQSALTLTSRLLTDKTFTKDGAAFLDAPKSDPAYTRVESSLLLAFTGMTQLETPAKGNDRVFQLRIYESPSVKTNQKKIEMFNVAGELPLFRKTGLNPVFFGEAIVGSKMPNLTYMLGFDTKDDMNKAWGTFVRSPEWKILSQMPQYKDDKILCGITNIVLKPASCSQI